MSRLSVVFCQYDVERYPNAFRALKGVVGALSGTSTTFVTVDNAREGDWSRQRGADLIEIGGDNSVHEFSAWSRGVEVFDRLNGAPDSYLFATDAFLAYGDDYGNILDASTLEFLLAQDGVAGMIDRPGRQHGKLECLGRVLEYWVRTSFFITTPRVLDRLGSLTTISDLDALCPTAYHGQTFNDDAPLNSEYRAYIEQWLTEKWHSAFDLSDATWDRFRDKARSIVNEHALTGRLRELGVPLYDLRFLRERRRESSRDVLDPEDRVVQQYFGDPMQQCEYYRRSGPEQAGLLRRILASWKSS